MGIWLWLGGCGGLSPTPTTQIPTVLPRSPAAAAARLEQLGWRPSCEGGVLADEISYRCTATGAGGSLVLDAVTTGAPLPEPDEGAAALVEDLWIEVRLQAGGSGGIDADESAALLRRYAPGHAW